LEKDLIDKLAEVEKFHWWFEVRRKAVETLLKDRVSGFWQILDVGAGTGGNYHLLTRFGDYYGIEPSAEARKWAREKGVKNLTEGTGEKISYPSQRFDLVVALDVLEHIKDDLRALREFRRVLKDKGLLLITVPAFNFLWSRHDELNHHFRRYRLKDIKRMLNLNGFEVEKATYIYFFLFPFLVIVRILQKFIPEKLTFSSVELKLPPLFINKILICLCLIEVFFIKWGFLPWGSSIIILAKKRESL